MYTLPKLYVLHSNCEGKIWFGRFFISSGTTTARSIPTIVSGRTSVFSHTSVLGNWIREIGLVSHSRLSIMSKSTCDSVSLYSSCISFRGFTTSHVKHYSRHANKRSKYRHLSTQQTSKVMIYTFTWYELATQLYASSIIKYNRRTINAPGWHDSSCMESPGNSHDARLKWHTDGYGRPSWSQYSGSTSGSTTSGHCSHGGTVEQNKHVERSVDTCFLAQGRMR